MNERASSVDWRSCPNAEAVAQAACDFTLQLLATTERYSLALPTGQTPGPYYAALLRAQATGQIDFQGASVFALDEYVGIASDAEQSFANFLTAHFVGPAQVTPANFHTLDGMSADSTATCTRFEEQILASGGLDIAVLGIGSNGHIAFNEPGSARDSRTRVVELSEATRRANAPSFDRAYALSLNEAWRAVPTHAMTMGIDTLLRAKHIVVIATGSHKRDALEAAFHGPISEEVPASFLQDHPRVVLFTDQV